MAVGLVETDLTQTTKRAFNLLGGVNQGSGLLLARGLEKREVNILEKIECPLRN